MNRCAAQGCGRWTRAGEAFCRRHRFADDVGEDDGSPDPARAGYAAFRARLAAGDFDAVLGPGLRGTLRGAAADPGLDAEIGALRLALVRLLDEERDPSRLATGVARVAGVAVQAAKLRHGGEVEMEQLRAELWRALAELETEEGDEVMGYSGDGEQRQDGGTA